MEGPPAFTLKEDRLELRELRDPLAAAESESESDREFLREAAADVPGPAATSTVSASPCPAWFCSTAMELRLERTIIFGMNPTFSALLWSEGAVAVAVVEGTNTLLLNAALAATAAAAAIAGTFGLVTECEKERGLTKRLPDVCGCTGCGAEGGGSCAAVSVTIAGLGPCE